MHYQVFLKFSTRAANTDRSDYMNWTNNWSNAQYEGDLSKNTEIQTQVITQKYQM